MSVTVDANVLIYSWDGASPHHAAANTALARVFASGEDVWLFPPVIVALLRVATHRRIMAEPFTIVEAFINVRKLFAIPSVQLGLPLDDFVEALEAASVPGDARGKLIHDAEIVALMRTHGVSRIVTADRDFRRFEGIEVTLLDR